MLEAQNSSGRFTEAINLGRLQGGPAEQRSAPCPAWYETPETVESPVPSPRFTRATSETKKPNTGNLLHTLQHFKLLQCSLSRMS